MIFRHRIILGKADPFFYKHTYENVDTAKIQLMPGHCHFNVLHSKNSEYSRLYILSFTIKMLVISKI